MKNRPDKPTRIQFVDLESALFIPYWIITNNRNHKPRKSLFVT
jgi:hypothetical protein